MVSKAIKPTWLVAREMSIKRNRESLGMGPKNSAIEDQASRLHDQKVKWYRKVIDHISFVLDVAGALIPMIPQTIRGKARLAVAVAISMRRRRIQAAGDILYNPRDETSSGSLLFGGPQSSMPFRPRRISREKESWYLIRIVTGMFMLVDGK